MASQVITVVGGNLFRIAEQYLGDARAAWRIAQASGLTDFWLNGPTVLVIPDANAAATNDGVPPQV